MRMRKMLFCLGLLIASFVCAWRADAQEPTNLYGAGVTYNTAAGSTPIAGTAFFAHKVVDASLPTYAFTVADFVPYQTTNAAGKSVFNFSNVSSNVGVGVMQKVATIGKLPIYASTSAGVSWTGSNTGWGFTGGGGTYIKIPNHSWAIAPTLRFAKSSVNNGAGYQLLPGVLFVWGQ